DCLLPERPADGGIRAPDDPDALVGAESLLSRVDLAPNAEWGRRRRAPPDADRVGERDCRLAVGRRRLRLLPGAACALAADHDADECLRAARACARRLAPRQTPAAVDRHDARARAPGRRAAELPRPRAPQGAAPPVQTGSRVAPADPR